MMCRPQSLTNSYGSLNPLLFKIKAFFSQKAAYIRVRLSQNQGLWRHFGVITCQGNLPFCSSQECGQIGLLAARPSVLRLADGTGPKGLISLWFRERIRIGLQPRRVGISPLFTQGHGFGTQTYFFLSSLSSKGGIPAQMSCE